MTAVPEQAMSALLANLQAKGLPDQLLVVLGTEFELMMWINGNDGREHDNHVPAGWGWDQVRAGGWGDGRAVYRAQGTKR